ncbi:toll/interleukin-1 receptor domain-containing protein [Parasphingopyxis sp.]|uniref:toll/interleukin-1 receptor domain-containing protein n=1 Tax=Parasphingopyxis sp. TaxID=1920299 RepID=UPI002629A097|nr:toll/interleukin-1 receptor domain-containing protein [Parasphingopyxis sp.]
MGKIFLSYASDDRKLARDIQARLRQHGHDVFFDEDALKPSDGYDRMIRNRIAKSDVMVFLCSRASLTEGRYTLTELEMAQRQWPNPEGRVLPVLIEDVTFDDLPSYIKGLSAYRYKGDPVSEVTHLAEEMVFVRRRKRRLSIGMALGAAALVIAAILLVVNQLGGEEGSPVESGAADSETTAAPAEPPPEAAPNPMDQSLPVIVLTGRDIARRANFQTVRERPDEHAICPGRNFNVYNGSSETLLLAIAFKNSSGRETLAPLAPEDHVVLTMLDVPGSYEADDGYYLMDVRSDNVLHFIQALDVMCL